MREKKRNLDWSSVGFRLGFVGHKFLDLSLSKNDFKRQESSSMVLQMERKFCEKAPLPPPTALYGRKPAPGGGKASLANYVADLLGALAQLLTHPC